VDLGLAGKVVLVTGAASGIGRACALAFAREGATVVLVDRDADGLDTLDAAIGERALVVPTDVTDRLAVDAAHDAALVRFGRIDIAFNNAGVIAPIAPLHELDEAHWDAVTGVNLKGVWLCMRAQLRHMTAAGGGVIVNTSSAAGLVGAPGTAAYTATKHGVLGLTRTAALEYAPRGIRINAVAPGTVDSPMMATFATHADPFADALVRRPSPLGRNAHPDEVADAVLWLASARSTFATGSTLVVDGGFTAQ